MRIEVGSYEAKTKLPELLRMVKKGQIITITNRGKAVADIVPSQCIRSKDRVAAVERLKSFMLAEPLPPADIKKLASEGRA